MADCPINQHLIPRSNQRSCGTVCHRQRTTINISRRREEVSERALMYSRKAAMVLFISSGDDTELYCYRLGPSPEWGQLNSVNAISPGVPLGECGLVQTIRKLHLVEI